MLPGFADEETFAKLVKAPGQAKALEPLPVQSQGASLCPVPLLTSQQICVEIGQFSENDLDAVALTHRYMMLNERTFRERITRADSALALRVAAAAQKDKQGNVDEVFSRWCFSLGFSLSDIALLHPVPVGAPDIAKALGVPLKSRSSNKVAAADMKTEDLRLLVKTASDVERLVCVFYRKRPMTPAAFYQWKAFLVDVGSGAARAEGAPELNRKRAHASMQSK
jgi:hypothetical protein